MKLQYQNDFSAYTEFTGAYLYSLVYRGTIEELNELDDWCKENLPSGSFRFTFREQCDPLHWLQPIYFMTKELAMLCKLSHEAR